MITDPVRMPPDELRAFIRGLSESERFNYWCAWSGWCVAAVACFALIWRSI